MRIKGSGRRNAKLAERMAKRGLTQRALAKEAGLSYPVVSKMVNGHGYCVASAAKVAEVLRSTPDLLGLI